MIPAVATSCVTQEHLRENPEVSGRFFEDVFLMEFMYFVFTRMAGDLPNGTRVFCCFTCGSSFER